MYKTLPIFLCVSFVLGACAVTVPEPTATPKPTSTPVPSPTAEWERAGWQIVWQDEFEGTELNLKNWTFDIGGNGWGNQELEAYTNRPENVRLEDGMLVIEAREEPEMIAGRDYSSARIKTQGLHAWQYGRIEARIKLPYGQGIWPAFWMLGDNLYQKGWPTAGEIDILEFIGRNRNTFMQQSMLPAIRAATGWDRASPFLPIRSGMTSTCMPSSGRKMRSAGISMTSSFSSSRPRMSLKNGYSIIHSSSS